MPRQDYDGTIRIDSKLDAEGLNKGASEASKKLSGIGKSIQGIGKGLASVGKIFAVGLLAVIVATAAAIGILVKTIFAIGKATIGAAKETLEYSKQVDEVKQTFARLKTSLLDAFRPLILFALPWINQVANFLIRILEMVAQVTAYITGQSGYWRTVAGNIENAGEAAKGSLASFDKLNVLQSDQQASKSGQPGQEWVEIGDEMPDFLVEIQGFIARIKELFSGDFSQIGQNLSAGIIGALKNARKAVQEFDFKGFGTDAGNGLNTIVSSIQSFLLNIDFKTIGSQFGGLMSDVFKGGLDTAIGFLQTVDWSNVGTTLWTAILGAIEFVKGYLEGYDWGGVASRVFELLGSAFGAAASFIAGLATAIWESLKSAWAGVKEYFEGFKDEAGGDIWQGIKDGIVNAGKNIYEWVKEHVVQPFINGFKKAFGIASPSTVMAEQGGYIIDGLKKGIEDAWGTAKTWFSDKVIEPLKGWFSEAWEDIKGFASEAWTDIEETWSTVSTWFSDNVTEPVKTFFSDAWDNIKGFFTGAWDDIKAVWDDVAGWFNDNVINPIIGFINRLIGAVETAVNWIVGGLNKISFDIPAWLGGGTFGINLTPVSFNRIPELAKGAVIPPNSEFLAILGDQRSGRNIETPERLLRDLIREELGRNQPVQDTIHNVIKLDGQVFYETMKKIDRRVGTSLISGSGIR